MEKSSIYNGDVLCLIPLMSITNRVALRTDPWGKPFSSVDGGETIVPSQTLNCLLDIKLCRILGSWTFMLQWSRVWRIPYPQAMSWAFSVSKNTATWCFAKKTCLTSPSKVTNWSTVDRQCLKPHCESERKPSLYSIHTSLEWTILWSTFHTHTHTQ